MPYLSKIPINPLRSGANRLLRNPQALHAAVLGGLAAQPVHERVLWRDERHGVACHILVLTQSRPSWEHIVEQAGYLDADGAQPIIQDLHPVLSLIARGREFSFRVRANPTMSQRSPQNPTTPQQRAMESGRRRGIRLGHRTVEHQLAWFLRRSESDDAPWGFHLADPDLPSVSIMQRERASFNKGPSAGRVTLERVTYGGRLVVDDPDRVRSVLLSGLGGGKAYGCGLLTLAGGN